MEWKEIAARITEIAPVAGATLGGPLGAGVGVAIKALAGAFGITSPSPQPQEVLQAIRDDPQALIKLDSARLAYEQENIKLELADMRDARARDVAIRQMGKGNIRADLMLSLAFIAIIAIAYLLAMGKVDGTTAVGGFLLTVGGMFARNIGTAFDFEFGSSRGSKEKDNVISGLSNGLKK